MRVISGDSIVLAFVGQFLTHAQHKMQAAGSVATWSSTDMAPVGQTVAHVSHRVHRSFWVMGEMFECISRTM